MKESKFKVGDTIFFMEHNVPKMSVIAGISRYEGEINSLHFKRTVPENTHEFVYHVGSYTAVEEKDAFASSEELENHVFANLRKESQTSK